MANNNVSDRLTKPGLGKKTYVAPVLVKYGALRQFTQGTQANPGDAGNAQMPAPMSDLNVKQNIVRVGDHPLGVGLYLFDYKPEYATSPTE